MTKKEEKYIQAKKDLVVAYKHIFATDMGQKIIDDLKMFCGYDAGLFFPGEHDKTVFALGARSAFIYIMSMMNTDPDEVSGKVKTYLDENENQN